MIRMLIRTGIFLGTAALGLILGDWFVPGMVLSVTGFLIAVVVFALAQSLITPLALRLTRRSGQALIGGMGLVSTGLALLVTSWFPGGVSFATPLDWVLGALVVWLVTALGWWLLPMWLLKDKASKARRN